MEDNDILSGTIGSTEIPMHGNSITPILIEESNPKTNSSINTQSPAPSPYHNPKNHMLIDSLYGITFKTINKDNPQIKCNYCNRLFACHRRFGTLAMMNHLQSACPNSPLKQKKPHKNQTLLQISFKKMVDAIGSGSPQLRFLKYDADKVRGLIARYLIKCELPFKHVKIEGYLEYTNGLEP